jgi:hypothetical protein
MDFSKIKTGSIRDRFSKVGVHNFGRYPQQGMSLHDWLQTAPDILGWQSLSKLALAIREARGASKPIIVGVGGHVIKCGLGPILVGLMRDGFITALASNGSVLVHDFEIAFMGATSEDVDAALPDGSFGVTEEPGVCINAAIQLAQERGIGLGAALGMYMKSMSLKYPEASVVLQAYNLSLPFTAHVSIGCDVWHLHPTADGAAMGKATFNDFQTFCDQVRLLNEGGVYLNIGSAVVLPEVFLKAVTAVRNLGHPLAGFTTGNLDFIQHYRPTTNVVRRPVAGVGKGYAVTGHHEIIVPLLAALLVEGLP